MGDQEDGHDHDLVEERYLLDFMEGEYDRFPLNLAVGGLGEEPTMTEAQVLLWQQMVARSFDISKWWWDSEERSCRDSQPPDGGDGPKEEVTMWVYRYVREGRYEVGYWNPEKKWFCDSVFDSPKEAADRVHWLMGG